MLSHQEHNVDEERDRRNGELAEAIEEKPLEKEEFEEVYQMEEMGEMKRLFDTFCGQCNELNKTLLIR